MQCLTKDDEFNQAVLSNAETTLKGFLTLSQEMKDYEIIFSVDDENNSDVTESTPN